MPGQAVWGPELSPAGDPTQDGLSPGGRRSPQRAPVCARALTRLAASPEDRDTHIWLAAGWGVGDVLCTARLSQEPPQQGPCLQAEVLMGSRLSAVHGSWCLVSWVLSCVPRGHRGPS